MSPVPSLIVTLHFIRMAGLAAICGCSSVAAVDKAPHVQVMEERDKNGALLHKSSFYWMKERGKQEMVLHGVQIEWYANGKKRKEVNFADGVRNGTTTEWDTGGQIVHQEEFVDGEKADAKPIAKLFGVESPPIHSRFRGWVGGVLEYEQLYDANNELVGIIIRSAGVNIARCVRSDRDDNGLYHHSHWAYWNQSGELLGTGVFRDHVPWEGICFTDHRDGSLSHTDFGRYHEGTLIEKVPAPVATSLGETPVPRSKR